MPTYQTIVNLSPDELADLIAKAVRKEVKILREDRMLTLKETSKLLNCSTETVRRRVKNNFLTNYGETKSPRFKLSEVMKWDQ